MRCKDCGEKGITDCRAHDAVCEGPPPSHAALRAEIDSLRRLAHEDAGKLATLGATVDRLTGQVSDCLGYIDAVLADRDQYEREADEARASLDGTVRERDEAREQRDAAIDELRGLRVVAADRADQIDRTRERANELSASLARVTEERDAARESDRLKHDCAKCRAPSPKEDAATVLRRLGGTMPSHEAQEANLRANIDALSASLKEDAPRCPVHGAGACGGGSYFYECGCHISGTGRSPSTGGGA